MTKKWDLEISNAKTEFKIGIYAKNWAKQVLLKNFDYSQQSELTINDQNQRSTDDCADVAVWRHLMAYVAGREAQQVRGARGSVGKRGLTREDRGGYWRRVAAYGVCAREAKTSAGACDAVSGRSWLGFARDWLFCLSMPFLWQLISESCRYCGRDGGGSLLIVTTGWRRGQRKNAWDVHRNQKVRGMALIPC